MATTPKMFHAKKTITILSASVPVLKYYYLVLSTKTLQQTNSRKLPIS